MLAAVLSAGAVLAAESVVRTRINRAPDGVYPHMLTRRIQIRRAHNSGIVGSRLEDRPGLAAAVQTASALVALGATALVHMQGLHTPLIGRIGAGLLAGGAIANTAERLAHGKVTDYIYLKESRNPLLRKRIWNIADAAIFNGAVLTSVGILLGGEL
jgi:lipoprotein signal peptidase